MTNPKLTQLSKKSILSEFERLSIQYPDIKFVLPYLKSLLDNDSSYSVSQNCRKKHFCQRLQRYILKHLNYNHDLVIFESQKALYRIQILDCLDRCLMCYNASFQISSAQMRQANHDYASIGELSALADAYFTSTELLPYLPIEVHKTPLTPTDIITWHIVQWQNARYKIDKYSNFISSAQYPKRLTVYLEKYCQITMELVPNNTQPDLKINGDNQFFKIDKEYYYGKKTTKFLIDLGEPSWRDLIFYHKDGIMKFLFKEYFKNIQALPEEWSKVIPSSYYCFLPNRVKQNYDPISWQALLDYYDKGKKHHPPKQVRQNRRSFTDPEVVPKRKILYFA